MGGQVGGDSICIDGMSAEAHSYLFKPASGIGRQRGAGENRRVKDKTRGERARERREAVGTDRSVKTRGQEVPKTVVISRQNTSPKKGTYAHTHPAPL